MKHARRIDGVVAYGFKYNRRLLVVLSLKQSLPSLCAVLPSSQCMSGGTPYARHFKGRRSLASKLGPSSFEAFTGFK